MKSFEIKIRAEYFLDAHDCRGMNPLEYAIWYDVPGVNAVQVSQEKTSIAFTDGRREWQHDEKLRHYVRDLLNPDRVAGSVVVIYPEGNPARLRGFDRYAPAHVATMNKNAVWGAI